MNALNTKIMMVAAAMMTRPVVDLAAPPSTLPPPGSPRPTWTPFPWPRESPESRAWSPPAAASPPPSSTATGPQERDGRRYPLIEEACLRRITPAT